MQQSYMDKIAPLQVGAKKYGDYVDEFAPGELSPEQIAEMKEVSHFITGNVISAILLQEMSYQQLYYRKCRISNCILAISHQQFC